MHRNKSFAGDGPSLTRRGFVSSMSVLPFASLPRPEASPTAAGALTYKFGTDAFEVMFWPEGSDHPPEANRMNGGGWCLVRNVDKGDDLARYSPDPVAAAESELSVARSEFDRLATIRDRMGEFAGRFEHDVMGDVRARLERAEARLSALTS